MFLFVRFLSEEKEMFEVDFGSVGTAEFACSKLEDPLTTANVYAVTAYDILSLKEHAFRDSIGLQQLKADDVKGGLESFPQFRNDVLNITKDDLAPKEDKALHRILVVDGLGINVNDIIYRGAAWRGLYKEILEHDVMCKIDFSCSTTFTRLAPLAMENGLSDEIFFGPIPLAKLLEYDYISCSEKMGSLHYSHTTSFKEQVGSLFDKEFSNFTLDSLKLGLKADFPVLIREQIETLAGGKKVALLNSAGEFNFLKIPEFVQENLAAQLIKEGYFLLTIHDLEIDKSLYKNILPLATSISKLSVVIDAVDLLVTTNSPAIALATGNGTPTVLLSVGSKEGIYFTQEVNAVEHSIANDSNFNNINAITEEEYSELELAWNKFEPSIFESLLGKLK